MGYDELYRYLLSLEKHISKRFDKTIYFHIDLIPLKERDAYGVFIDMIGDIKTEKKYLWCVIEKEKDLQKLERVINTVVTNSLDSNKLNEHEMLLLHFHTCDVKEKMLLMH